MSKVLVIVTFVFTYQFLYGFVEITAEKFGQRKSGMSKDEKVQLKLKSIEMFEHAYGSYKKYAYPADELMPLSCKGRNRGSELDRGDIDDALGNFSLTLIDTLDTLVVLGKIDEFEEQVKFVISSVSFDTDVVVSVFETNIRILGGLLGAHSVAIALKDGEKGMLWYTDQLLIKATDIADRLLAAFNTTTGIPYPKVNLRHGVNTPKSRVGHETDTCTACAGTMIMEFGALSRMSGNPIYEQKAHKAMEALWMYRSHHTDLVGTTINIHNGNWIRRDSGIGAGIDSYYEYCLKAYILFGDEWYLKKFNKHYAAIEKYVKKGFMLVDVLMNDPGRKIRSHMDSLQAFWPGLQVLKGDLQSAIETHEMLYTVAKKFKFLPEAFTTDFNLHWAQHPLRPEFVESTYFLYQATKDPYYLTVGKHIIDSLEKYARVPCGFAALKDLRTLSHENKMDSFVLAETFKYLYLLFSEESEHVININDFILTTEAHLLPLYLSTVTTSGEKKNSTNTKKSVDQLDGVSIYLDEISSSCPNTKSSITDMLTFAEKIRQNVNLLLPVQQEQPMCNNVPTTTSKVMNEKESEKILTVIKFSTNRIRRLKAANFVFDNFDHLQIIKEFGITLNKGDDNKIQLMHQAALAATSEDAEEGLIFMQEMIQLSKQRGTNPGDVLYPRVVQFLSPPFNGHFTLTAGSAQFGVDLSTNNIGVSGLVVESIPLRACQHITNEDVTNRIVVMERGECMFIDKVRLAQSKGASGVIIVDHIEGTSVETSQAFAMSGDSNLDDVTIPSVFLFKKEGDILRKHISESKHLNVRIAAKAVIKNDDVKDVEAISIVKTTEEEEGEISEELRKKYDIKEDEKLSTYNVHEVKAGEDTPPVLHNQYFDGKAERQEVEFNADGGKTVTTYWSYIGPSHQDNGEYVKHVRRKIDTCPTTECNQGVNTIYIIGEEKIEQVGDKLSKHNEKVVVMETIKTDEKNGESYIDQIISESLKDKIDHQNIVKKENGKICSSAGCFDSMEELNNVNNLASGILKNLKQIQNKLRSTMDNVLENGDKAEFDVDAFKSLLDQANQLDVDPGLNGRNILTDIKENFKMHVKSEVKALVQVSESSDTVEDVSNEERKIASEDTKNNDEVIPNAEKSSKSQKEPIVNESESTPKNNEHSNERSPSHSSITSKSIENNNMNKEKTLRESSTSNDIVSNNKVEEKQSTRNIHKQNDNTHEPERTVRNGL